MIHNQIQIVKSALIIVFSLLTLFTIKASFEDENLLWMPVILLPLLILSFYQFSQQKHPVLWKYLIMRQIPASKRRRKDSTNTLPSTRLKKKDLAFIIGNKNDPQSYKAGVFNIRIRNKAVKSLADHSFQSQTCFSDDANIYDLIEGDRILHVGPNTLGVKLKKVDLTGRNLRSSPANQK